MEGFVKCLMIVGLLFMFKRSTLRTGSSVCMVATVDVRVVLGPGFLTQGPPKAVSVRCLPRPSLLPKSFLEMSKGRGMSSPHTFIGSSSPSTAPISAFGLILYPKCREPLWFLCFMSSRAVNLLHPTRAGEVCDLIAWTGAHNHSSCSALFVLQPQELNASDPWFYGTWSLIATLTPPSPTSH